MESLFELLQDGVRLRVALVVEEDEGVVLLGQDVLQHGRVHLVDDASDLGGANTYDVLVLGEGVPKSQSCHSFTLLMTAQMS